MKTSGQRLLSYREAAERFGINRSTLSVMVSRREIPHVRLGPRHVKFDAAELEAWLDARRVPQAELPDNR